MKFNENRFRGSGDMEGKLHDLEHEFVQPSHGFCTLPH